MFQYSVLLSLLIMSLIEMRLKNLSQCLPRLSSGEPDCDAKCRVELTTLEREAKTDFTTQQLSAESKQTRSFKPEDSAGDDRKFLN